MIPENVTAAKKQSSQQSQQLIIPKCQLIRLIPPSEHVDSHRNCIEHGVKSSDQLLDKIFALIDEKQRVIRKDSLKTTDKKDTPNNFKCKCKKTKCLKMYCQCFAVGKLCNGCNCCDCQNLLQFQQARATAIDQALERDPDIFQAGTLAKKGGCICKKTQCLKKYCECYSSGIPCTSECKCQNCSNTQ